MLHQVRHIMRFAAVLGCVVAWGMGALASARAAGPTPDLSTLDARLKQMVLREHLGSFWGCVVIAHEGRIVAKACGGVGDATNQRPIDEHSLFDIASVSKQFTGAAILRLAQEGRLDLNDSVSRFFDVGGASDDITIRMLATHTSGLDDVVAIQTIGFEDRDEAVKRAMRSRLQSPPGTAFAYSNAGYIVLAAIVERVTKGTFEDYVVTQLLPASGASEVRFIAGGFDTSKATARVVVRGRGKHVQPLWSDPAGEPWGWGLRGAGGVVASAAQMVAWDDALRGGELLDDPSKLTLFEASVASSPSYSFGLEVERTPWGSRRASHSGATRGYRAQTVSHVDDAIFIVCLTNYDFDPTRLATLAERLVYPQLRPALEARSNLKDLELGKYHSFEEQIAWQASIEKADDAGIARVRLLMSSVDAGVPRFELVLSVDEARTLAGKTRAQLEGRALEAGTSHVGLMSWAPLDDAGWLEAVTPRSDDVRILLMPSYNRGQDPRMTLAIIDDERQRWPILVMLAPRHALALADALEGILQALAAPAPQGHRGQGIR